jgi:hypothetical protein
MNENNNNNGVAPVATETAKRGRGRPRLNFTKQVVYVKKDGVFVPRGKGKPAKGAEIEIRTVNI